MTETTGQRLRRLRGKRTLQEVSQATGLAKSTLSMMEKDKRGTGDKNKRRLAEYYGRSVAYIFFQTSARDSREEART